MSEILKNTALVVALVSGVSSVIGTIYLARASIKTARIRSESDELSATDEVATGAATMLAEYRSERESLRAEIDRMSSEIDDLKKFQRDVIRFIKPFFEGSKENYLELIKNGIDPPYKIPAAPDWLIIHD